ncbi:DUF7147 family protein [Alkalibacillus haloalkaliphilus]|uniref:DUF7147 family protein n=1 Tax=Alkalibacillus haloalkaliphilus TaxID=94136 RepID=UPI0029360239|nr:methylthioribose kinase [Alkalibacillus haloalkaliphilus]MDV2582514.1 methylthioribose kinase [Alkalibacillus haloalkaliphilus]
MTQHFIKLGEGYGDVYELITLIDSMPSRVKHLLAFHTHKQGQDVTSIAAILNPTSIGHFQPVYICLEGIPKPKEGHSNVRYDAFKSVSERIGVNIIELEVQPSTTYYDEQLFYQQLIAVLRLNHLLPPI